MTEVQTSQQPFDRSAACRVVYEESNILKNIVVKKVLPNLYIRDQRLKSELNKVTSVDGWRLESAVNVIFQ